MNRLGTPVLIVVLGLLLVAGIGGFLPSYYVGLATESLIVALFVMSLDLLVGFTGLESLGHAAFFGVGAYVAGLLSLSGTSNVFVLLAAATVATGLLGALFGAVALRAVGPYFLIITLALGYLPWALAIRWRSLTGGDDGLSGIFLPDLGFGYSLDGQKQYFTFVVVLFFCCSLVLGAVGRSSFGLCLRGIKDSPSRMEALGYDIWLHKYLAFIIAAFFAGIAGALFALYNGFVSPENLSLYRSAEALVAVILGGPGTLIGPAIGAIFILFLRSAVGSFTQHWGSILGIIYILVVLFAPRGLFFAASRLLSPSKEV